MLEDFRYYFTAASGESGGGRKKNELDDEVRSVIKIRRCSQCEQRRKLNNGERTAVMSFIVIYRDPPEDYPELRTPLAVQCALNFALRNDFSLYQLLNGFCRGALCNLVSYKLLNVVLFNWNI